MKYLVAAALVATTVAGFGGAANAAGGCGPGYYRGAYGHCRPKVGAVVIRRPAVVVVPRAHGCRYGMVWRHGRCRY